MSSKIFILSNTVMPNQYSNCSCLVCFLGFLDQLTPAAQNRTIEAQDRRQTRKIKLTEKLKSIITVHISEEYGTYFNATYMIFIFIKHPLFW